MADAVCKSKFMLNKSKSLIKKSFNIRTCAYFGIFDCNCCEVNKQIINNMSSDNEIMNLPLKEKFSVINLNPSVSTSLTSQDDLNEPSTSSKTESDMVDKIYSINSDVDLKEDLKIKEYEEKFEKMSDEEIMNLPLKEKFNLINIKPSTSTSKTSQVELNEPSTSSKTESDILDDVYSIISDVDLKEEELKIKKYEEKFEKMIKSECSCSTKSNISCVSLENLMQEEEEIDVVNILPEELNIENQLTTDIEQQTEQINESVAFLDVLDNEEEIDVVNLPINEDILSNLQKSSLENISNEQMERKNKRSRSPTINENMTSENVQNQIEDEEEIDVVNLPHLSSDFDEDAPLSTFVNRIPEIPKRKRRKTVKNILHSSRNIIQSSNEEEIIDVVNLTDDTQERASLSNNLVTANYALDLHRTPKRSAIVDLINSTTREESIIEISDSPIVISEVIDIDDDDMDLSCPTPKKANFGNCPVCFEELSKSEIMSTMCGHIFCSVCIKTVIKTTKKCPKCRKHLTLKGIHPLFF